MKLPSKRFLWGVAGGLLLVSAAYSLAVTYLLFVSPPELEARFRSKLSMPFDAQEWEQSSFGDIKRYALANGLVFSRKIIGKTEAEVRAMLGQTDSEYNDGNALFLGFELIAQKQMPAKSCLLPAVLFLNTDTWLLEVKLVNGQVVSVRIIHT